MIPMIGPVAMPARHSMSAPRSMSMGGVLESGTDATSPAALNMNPTTPKGTANPTCLVLGNNSESQSFSIRKHSTGHSYL